MYKLLPCYKTHTKCWKPETKIGSGIPIASEPSPARRHFVLVKLILIFNEIERGAATLKAINLVSRWIRNIQRMMRKKSAISPPFFTHCNFWVKFDKLLLLNYGDFCTIIIIDTIFILSWNIEVIPVIFIKHMSSNFISIDSLSSWSHHPVFSEVMSVSAVQAQDGIVRYWLMPCSAAVIVSPSPPCRRTAVLHAACDLLIHHG